MAFANLPAAQSRFLISGSADNEMRHRSPQAGLCPFRMEVPDGGQVYPSSASCVVRKGDFGSSDDAGRVSYRELSTRVCGPVDIAIIASGNRSIRLSDILDPT
jgi:hypothetical protein